MIPSQRKHYLDWLRVLMLGIVIAMHGVMPFNSASEWSIMNAETTFVATSAVGFVFQWGMPLFFLLAGASTGLALRRHGTRGYVRARLRRLMLPYAAGVLALSPLQVYLEDAHRAQARGSLLSYYADFIPARFGIEWHPLFGLNAFHLWFLQYLFECSMFLLPLLLWFGTPAGARAAAALGRLAAGRAALLWAALPIAAIQMALSARYHGYMDWSDWACWLACFVYGHLLATDERIADNLRRRAWPHLAAAAACFAAIGALFAMGLVEPWEKQPAYTAGFLGYQALRSLNTTAWVLALLGLAMRYLGHAPRLLAHLNEAVLPCYILHHPVLIALAYFVVQAPIGILPKYLLIVAGTVLATAALYGALVRPFNLLRYPMGLELRRAALARAAD